MAKDITTKDMNARVDKLREKLRATDSKQEAKKVAKEASQEAKRIESEAAKKAMKVAREIEVKANNAVKSSKELEHCVQTLVRGQRRKLTNSTENYLILSAEANIESECYTMQHIGVDIRAPVEQIASILRAEIKARRENKEAIAMNDGPSDEQT